MDTPIRHYKRKTCAVPGCVREHGAKGYCLQPLAGERYSKPKYRQRTLAEIEAIRKLYEAGVKVPEIARRFECSQSTVARIVSGRTFRRVFR